MLKKCWRNIKNGNVVNIVLMLLMFLRSVVMFIVEDVTYNICDQKFHEFEIRRQNPDVFVIR